MEDALSQVIDVGQGVKTKLSNVRNVKEEDFVILKYGETRRLVQVQVGKLAFISKEKVLSDNAIGKPFGSIFELKGQKLIYIESRNVDNVKAPIDTEGLNVLDNRSLVDDGKSQKLSREEIEKLKSAGCDTTEIIKTIVENSSSFKEKTVFSQEKYIKRKQSKYNKIIAVLHPTIRLLSEMYFAQGPSKICNMRIDSLSQMMSYANVVSGGSYIVVDDCLGLLVAAVIDRINDKGHVIQVFPGQGPVSTFRQSVHALNISTDKLLKTLHGIPFGRALNVLQGMDVDEQVKANMRDTQELETDSKVQNSGIESNIKETEVVDQMETEEKDNASSKNKMENYKQSESEMNTGSGKNKGELDVDIEVQNSGNECMMKEKVEEQMETRDDKETNLSNTNKRKNNNSMKSTTDYKIKKEERIKRKEERLIETKIALDLLETCKIDGLLIACRHHPSSVLLQLLPFLAFSRPFVIHSTFLPPLVDCYKTLKESEETVFLNITENWMRNYQVLTDRTHPFVNMSNNGGYLLTGIRVAKSSA